MIYEVKAGCEIILQPQSEVEEIAQNIRMIVSTPKGSAPLDRNFGINLELLDRPIGAAKARLTSEICAAVRSFEPRAQVTEILYPADPASGKLTPIVRFKLRGGFQ